MKKTIKFTAFIFTIAMLMTLVGTTVLAATTQLSSDTLIVKKGENASIRLLNSTGTTKWSVGNSKVFTYKNKTVTGKSVGKSNLYAKNNGNQYKCKVIVVADEILCNSTISLNSGKTTYISFDTTNMKEPKVKMSGSSYASVSKLGSDVDSVAVSIKGKKSGTAKITVYDDENKNNQIVLRIKIKSPDSSVISNKTTADTTNNTSNSTKLNSNGNIYFTNAEDDAFNNNSTNLNGSVSAADEIDAVIRQVNEERRAAGLSELEKDESLCESCAVRVNEIGTDFSHTRPDGSSCFTAITISYKACGENIAWGQRSASDVMDSWMNSSGHRSNILNSSYTKIGVGYDPSTKCWVQLFVG